jgi:hypothetical protein
MNRFISTLLGIVLLGGVTSAGHAAPITRTFDVSVVNFVCNACFMGAPTDPATVNFTVTFDPAGPSVMDQTSDITLNSTNLFSGQPLGTPLGFNYDPAFDNLIIGGLGNGGAASVSSVDGHDFALSILGASSAAPTILDMIYLHATWPTVIWEAENFEPFSSLTFTQANTGPGSSTDVPEPSSVIVTLIGLGAVATGLAWRRRRIW